MPFFLPPLAAVFTAATLSAAPRLVYDVPLQWVRVASDGDAETYETSFDRAQRLVVAIRSVDTGDRTAEEWALAEAERMRRQTSRKLGKPLEEDFGETHWVYLDWADPELGERGRDYYLEGEGASLAEVSIFAQDEVFRRADASKFDGFLASFRFEDKA
ncbi:MAG TPA: hypothetical protein VL404_05435 [Candidatus Eisenbacteria bacterium]|nr:hypothetical protein [Candidatus Eisenbacteria bacterium]